jgi:hypothetical protein
MAADMSEFWTGSIWYLAVFGFFAGIALFVWKDILRAATFQGWRRKFLVGAAVIYSFNLPLFVACLGIGLWGGRGALPATATEYKAVLVMGWIGLCASVMTIGTVLLAVIAAPGLARRLCILGSAVALLCWGTVAFASSDLLVAYEIKHQCFGKDCMR